MTSPSTINYIAFSGHRRIVHGAPDEVATMVKLTLEQDPRQTILVFNDQTSEQIDLDLHGSLAEVLARYQPLSTPKNAQTESDQQKTPRAPGRPKLGVIAREITLFPRHWEWLAAQPGGASVTLRKLVERELRGAMDKDRLRELCDAAYRFMQAIAGDLPDFDEASRALFAMDKSRFCALIKDWPVDIRTHIEYLTQRLFNCDEPYDNLRRTK